MVPLVVCFIFVFFLLYTPYTFAPPAVFRTFDSDDKAFQAALGTMFLRLFGTIPAPILVGKVIDATCVVWQDYGGERGSCLVYDNVAMVNAFLTFRKYTLYSNIPAIKVGNRLPGIPYYNTAAQYRGKICMAWHVICFQTL